MPKKFKLPVFAILIFAGYVALQIFSDIFKPAQIVTNIDPRKEQVYQQLFDGLVFKTIDGEQINLSSIKEPVVILNFWASWCGPCLVEIPSLVSLQKSVGSDKIKIIGINSESIDARRKLEGTIRKYGINYSVVHDSDERIASLFAIRSLPTTIIFKEQSFYGIVVGTYEFSMKDFFPNDR